MSDINEQVAKQCDAVVHLCKALIEVHGDQAKMIRDGILLDIVPQIGDRTAFIMETLGDILSNMDSVTDEDEWLNPIYAEAQRLFPQVEQ